MAGQEPADGSGVPARAATTTPRAAAGTPSSDVRSRAGDSADRVTTRRIPPPLGRTVSTHGTFTWRGPAAAVTFVAVRPASPRAATPDRAGRGGAGATTAPSDIPTVSPRGPEELVRPLPDGRGWSHGQALTDPRTGEILAGRVRLGSQRTEQVTALA
ncbi:hypothetical protein HCN56_25270, partial [Streptomyces lonarensis]|nr:hypothetical protein [Streptomyces lonarensis]